MTETVATIEIEKTEMGVGATLSGMLRADYEVGGGTYDTLVLVQPNGYLIDLIFRVQELALNYGRVHKLCYWTAPQPATKDQLITAQLDQLEGGYELRNINPGSGYLDVGFISEVVGYSEWTSRTEYTTSFRLGSHDLFKELKGQHDKFVMLEFTFGGKR